LLVVGNQQGGENKKLMEKDPGLKERIGSIGNQFAITQVFYYVQTRGNRKTRIQNGYLQ